MLTNFFKKDSTFSYVRLFFILCGCLLLAGASFGVYVVARMQTVEHNQQLSKDFFQKYETSSLQYSNKRQQYTEQYGKPSSISVDTKNKVIVDTYLSADGTKGMTLRYQMINDTQDDAILVGYLISGDTAINDEVKISLLKQSKGQKLNDIQKQCGVGKVLSESEDELMYTLAYATNEEVVILKIDKKMNQISDVKIEKNNK